MLKEKLKTTNRNYLKKNALYILLIISNVILFTGLINYYLNIGMNVDIETIQNASAVIATIIILGFISIRLPNIKDMGDHPLYGMGALVLICGIGVITSYFGAKLSIPTLLDPYLDMFKYLSAVLIFILIATNLKSFKEILRGKFTKKNQLVCLIIFAAIGLFASYVHMSINDAPANIRCLVVMISGLFGGPVVGIPVGIISAAYRYSLGGITAVPCSISTVISGIVGSLIFLWNGKKFPRLSEALLLMFLFTGFEMLMIVLLTPPDISFPFVKDIYPVMAFASVMGMLLFSIVIWEEKQKRNTAPNDEELQINEIEDELKGNSEKIKEFENEIEDLKKEIEDLKKEKIN